MPRPARKILSACLFLTGCAIPLTAFADRPALDGRGSVGYFTYKSKYANSNDTGLRYDYAAALYAGNSRGMGMIMRGNLQSANFALVTKKLDSSTLDFIIRSHLGPLYFGPMFGMSNYKFTESGSTTFDLNERHYGGNVGLEMDIIRNGLMRIDALITNQYDYKEVTNQTVTLGMRVEGDVSFDLMFSKKFGAVVGGKYIMYSLQSQAEAITMPYAGLRARLDF